RAVQASPKSRPLRARLVEVLALAGYWKDAEAECRRALETDPTNHLPLLTLVTALVRHDRAEDAVILSRKASEIAPNAPEAHAVLGAVSAKMGRHEDAISAYRRSARLRSTYHFAEKWLAGELAATGRWEEAIRVLETAAASEPKNYLWPCEAGKVYRAHGKPAEAAMAFQKAATLSPALPDPWEGLAAACLDLGRFAEARAATERL